MPTEWTPNRVRIYEVATRHPSHYRLVNIDDGTVWEIDDDHWRRSTWLAAHDAEVRAAVVHYYAPGPAPMCGVHDVSAEITTYRARVTCAGCLWRMVEAAEVKVRAVEAIHHPIEVATSASSDPNHVPHMARACSCNSDPYRPCATLAALADPTPEADV